MGCGKKEERGRGGESGARHRAAMVGYGLALLS